MSHRWCTGGGASCPEPRLGVFAPTADGMFRNTESSIRTVPTAVRSDFLNANRKPLRAHENICVFYKKQPTYNAQKTDGKPYKSKSGETTSSNFRKFNGNYYTENKDGKRCPLSVLQCTGCWLLRKCQIRIVKCHIGIILRQRKSGAPLSRPALFIS